MNDKRPMSDFELFNALRNGDRNAFDEIYSKYWERVYVEAKNKLKNRSSGEECCHGVFTTIWIRRTNLDVAYSLEMHIAALTELMITRIMKVILAKAMEGKGDDSFKMDKPLSEEEKEKKFQEEYKMILTEVKPIANHKINPPGPSDDPPENKIKLR